MSNNSSSNIPTSQLLASYDKHLNGAIDVHLTSLNNNIDIHENENNQDYLQKLKKKKQNIKHCYSIKEYRERERDRDILVGGKWKVPLRWCLMSLVPGNIHQ